MSIQIRTNPDGTLDEVIARNVTLYLEQMTAAEWCLILDAADGRQWVLSLTADTMLGPDTSLVPALWVTVQEAPA